MQMLLDRRMQSASLQDTALLYAFCAQTILKQKHDWVDDLEQVAV